MRERTSQLPADQLLSESSCRVSLISDLWLLTAHKIILARSHTSTFQLHYEICLSLLLRPRPHCRHGDSSPSPQDAWCWPRPRRIRWIVSLLVHACRRSFFGQIGYARQRFRRATTSRPQRVCSFQLPASLPKPRQAPVITVSSCYRRLSTNPLLLFL